MSGSNVYMRIRPALLCPLAIWGAGFWEAGEGLLREGGGGVSIWI